MRSGECRKTELGEGEKEQWSETGEGVKGNRGLRREKKAEYRIFKLRKMA